MLQAEHQKKRPLGVSCEMRVFSGIEIRSMLLFEAGLGEGTVNLPGSTGISRVTSLPALIRSRALEQMH